MRHNLYRIKPKTEEALFWMIENLDPDPLLDIGIYTLVDGKFIEAIIETMLSSGLKQDEDFSVDLSQFK